MSAVLDVRGLTVAIGGTPIVHGVDLRVDAGECVALVGASGSGKTVTARAVLGLSAPGAAVHADVFAVDGVDVGGYTDRRWRRLRGSRVGYVGQEALGALDPLRPVGREVADSLRLHTEMRAAERVDAVRDALAAVGLDPDIATGGRLAGTLSGGMRQRALIAAATVGSPALLVADEPTTALDAGVAVTVMEQLRAAQTRGAGLLVITHDLGLVAGWADRVAVVHEGRIVEHGAVAEVFAAPTHPATRALVRAAGAAASPAAASPAAVRCEVPDAVRGVEARTGAGSSHGSEPTSHGARGVLAAQGLSREYDGVLAVDDVSFGLVRGRVLGVIGASGSGKTTLARMILGLETPDAGTVTLDDDPWVPLPERERRPRRHRVAAVVQDPGATFDERWNVERVLADAFSRGDERRARGVLGERVDAALRQVDLDPVLRSRSPRTLSGGQRQRLAIARALATDPEVIVLDEPVTALDATVQDAVLRLLERLRDETGVAMVFVSHDLRAVRRMADDVLVVHRGAVVEHGPVAEVFARPAHPVTARLLHAAERLAAGPAAGTAAGLTG
ncbi:ABC transporter ATP-binding protein [Curtobacterium flaccumfaciens]|uniref:ABC transporter ATP-binding protein n=1 Tax=Curtobacterium flaccumfaciens TaxID=2035 RepID=UPI001BDF2666|nr:ABC transporter ATP-binding protein [Curtobacterium flaccumfaciens]MBT1608239.1 ABC transporter ATP-binding protein [Curtobacterium flaccumfaciens pv. betae]MBT1657298.1 ABC transporter ATP-binding protein [Curtobacterium flaccumfaciens pv. betae]MCS0471108.1 ABC transporter ATP-binding protein [Curtobacterium flaccumfaciens pv. betae]MCS0474365.1 ABC transporter ATP-binding protein [Curtobacterium flaccumfaciens pv. betae]MCS0477762.1 ABC transporter ATP-binding protein [Curtobacterium fla